MAINSKNRSFFLLLAIFFISLQKLFSVSSYTITTDQQFKTFQSTNIVVVEEGYLLLSNHFEKINVVFRPSPRHSYSADYSSTTKKFSYLVEQKITQTTTMTAGFLMKRQTNGKKFLLLTHLKQDMDIAL